MEYTQHTVFSILFLFYFYFCFWSDSRSEPCTYRIICAINTPRIVIIFRWKRIETNKRKKIKLLKYRIFFNSCVCSPLDESIFHTSTYSTCRWMNEKQNKNKHNANLLINSNIGRLQCKLYTYVFSDRHSKPHMKTYNIIIKYLHERFRSQAPMYC